MSIEYKNDGKGKHQSWSAAADLNDTIGGSISINLTAYGATKSEAWESFDKLAQSAVRKICEVASEGHLESAEFSEMG